MVTPSRISHIFLCVKPFCMKHVFILLGVRYLDSQSSSAGYQFSVRTNSECADKAPDCSTTIRHNEQVSKVGRSKMRYTREHPSISACGVVCFLPLSLELFLNVSIILHNSLAFVNTHLKLNMPMHMNKPINIALCLPISILDQQPGKFELCPIHPLPRKLDR